MEHTGESVQKYIALQPTFYHQKRQKVYAMLIHPQFQNYSDRRIAVETGTTQPFVSYLRHYLEKGQLELDAHGCVLYGTKRRGCRHTYTYISHENPLDAVWQRMPPHGRQMWVAANLDEVQRLIAAIRTHHDLNTWWEAMTPQERHEWVEIHREEIDRLLQPTEAMSQGRRENG